EGTVTPDGNQNNIGGIVGHNEGTVEDSKFTGVIKGGDTVGGLVGWNGTSANITNSSFDGELYGETKVGGITGYNAGTVLSSRNKSNVMNDTCEEINRDPIHIGGIAGVNVGVIEDSENMGNIGYPSNGYNIGGIAG